MDCFASQQPSINFYCTDSQGQFQWNSTANDPAVNPDVPRCNISDNFESLFTPEQVSALLAACDSTWSADPFSADFPPECLNQSDWDLSACPELPIPLVENAFIQPSLTPVATGCTTYRNGFGDPIQPVEYRPYDSPVGYESTPTPPAMASGTYSPSDSYPGYIYYPLSQPSSSVQPLTTWNLVASPNNSTSKNSTRIDATSSSTVSEPPIKKHRCQTCGRAFQRQTTLTQHQITHTGERPYSCPISGCDKAFTTASNAKRHAKTHFRISHGFHHVSSSPGPF